MHLIIISWRHLFRRLAVSIALPLCQILLSLVSVPWFENTKWKLFRNKYIICLKLCHSEKNAKISAIPLHPKEIMRHLFSQYAQAPIHKLCCPIFTQYHVEVYGITMFMFKQLVFNLMMPKHKSSETGLLQMTKRRYKMLPFLFPKTWREF